MATVKQLRPGSPPKARVSSSVGERIRTARKRAGMTQQQVAGDRYTKAYISALENGLVRPSVVALEYLAERLSTSPSALMADGRPAWTRLDADLLLASGKWQEAVDAYEGLLAGGSDSDQGAQAEIRRGLAEALVRLDRGSEAAGVAAQAAESFERLSRPQDAALANYWLSAGLYEQDNTAEAKSILQTTLAKVRMGMRVEPDFKLRLLMALSSNEARDDNYAAALTYLEEVRGFADELDDRRRAAYLFDLANSYCELGDYEAAIRTGYASLALFRAAETGFDTARLENELAIAHLRTGNSDKAAELAAQSRSRFEGLRDDRQLAHVLDTQAQVELARGDLEQAARLAEEALRLARSVDNAPATTDALLTMARILAAKAGTRPAPKASLSAKSAFDLALQDARQSGRPQTVKRVLTEYADFLAASGDHKAAFELSREALASGR